LSETTSNEILAKLDYFLCTFGAFLDFRILRKTLFADNKSRITAVPITFSLIFFQKPLQYT